ncbi:MAG: hypothetical protein HW420_614 [Candidatus Nitrosotenuis sp.]|nr:hypothetical protein [Candidatus Nitrosotenuis sp.]
MKIGDLHVPTFNQRANPDDSLDYTTSTPNDVTGA